MESSTYFIIIIIFFEMSLTENKIAYCAGFSNGLPGSTELGVGEVKGLRAICRQVRLVRGGSTIQGM